MIKSKNIKFSLDYCLAKKLFINAGQILDKRGFANAKYWTEEKIEKEYKVQKQHLNQKFYVMFVNGIPAGAAILQTQTEDVDLWTDYKTTKALYISKMCIVSPFRGKHYSELFFDFCINEAKKSFCDFIRFDTCADSKAHCEYYKKCGFKEMGIINDGEENLCLFQMALQKDYIIS